MEPRSYSFELQKEWDYKTEEFQMAKMNIRGRQLLWTLIEYFKPWELGEGFFTMTDLMKTAIRGDPKHCDVAGLRGFWDRWRKVIWEMKREPDKDNSFHDQIKDVPCLRYDMNLYDRLPHAEDV